MKKITEYLLTFAGIGIIASGCVFAMGCTDVDTEKVSENLNNVVDKVADAAEKYDDSKDAAILNNIYEMTLTDSCLNYIEMESYKTDCNGKTNSYKGCVMDNVTLSEEKTIGDYVYVTGCMGCYFVAVPFPTSDENVITPSYGCYTKSGD